MELKNNIILYDNHGRAVSSPKEKIEKSTPGIKKNAIGLYGNIYSYPNYGQFRPRFYTLSDTEQGLDSLSRELLVRWSRETVAQMPWIGAAIRLLAQYAVGNAYEPVYSGEDEHWGKLAIDWLKDEFYLNCCTRGRAYDFQTVMFLESTMLDQDGDILCLYGKDKTGFPKFQMIPSNRIRSATMDNHSIEDGPFKGNIIADGVIYNAMGQAVGYSVTNPNTMATTLGYSADERIISARDCQLIYDARFFDKARGVPSVGFGILQALSIQELDSYLTERIKVESTVALIEKTPTGEAPYQLQQTLMALEAESTQYGVFNAMPNIGGVRMVKGADVRYIKADGGDIKSLASNTPGDQTANYIKRLETHILSVIGVPDALIFSPDSVSGRITSGLGEIFRSSVERRQKILDKHAKFIIAWALSNAMENGYIPRNKQENIYRVMGVTHPTEFTLDEGYSRKADLDDLNAGVLTLEDILKKQNKSVDEVINSKGIEAMKFFAKAQEVALSTKIDINTILAYMKGDLKITIKTSEIPVEAKV